MERGLWSGCQTCGRGPRLPFLNRGALPGEAIGNEAESSCREVEGTPPARAAGRKFKERSHGATGSREGEPRDEGPPKTMPTVEAPRHSLIVLAGLPGAGKSTVLKNLTTDEPVTLLDSAEMWRLLTTVLPKGTPYGWCRPLVHLLHRVRIGWACIAGSDPVIAHEPSTRAPTRVMLVLFGRLARRELVFVWLDVEPAEALAGQHQRGRLLNQRSFRRHVRRAVQLRSRFRQGRSLRGWASVTVFRRADVDHGLRFRVRG